MKNSLTTILKRTVVYGFIFQLIEVDLRLTTSIDPLHIIFFKSLIMYFFAAGLAIFLAIPAEVFFARLNKIFNPSGRWGLFKCLIITGFFAQVILCIIMLGEVGFRPAEGVRIFILKSSFIGYLLPLGTLISFWLTRLAAEKIIEIYRATRAVKQHLKRKI